MSPHTASHSVERERFMVAMESEGMPREISRRILRHAQTIQRLSEAECNGDWPCDNGERKVESCARCEAGYVRSSMVLDPRTTAVHQPECNYIVNGPDRWPDKDGKAICNCRRRHPLICPNCRAQDLIRGWCNKVRGVKRDGDNIIAVGFVPIFQGDPRSACVAIKVPSGTHHFAHEGVVVPTR